jgi:hypothetical protein
MRWLAHEPHAVAFVVLAPLIGSLLVVTGVPAPGWISLVVLASGVLSLVHTSRWMRNADDLRSHTKKWANVSIAASAAFFGLFVAVVLVAGFGPMIVVRT